MAIGIDLDEVLAPLLKHHCLYLNQKYGLQLKEEDFFTYDFHEVYHVSSPEAINDFYEFTQTEFFRQIQPYPDAIDGVNQLRSLDELVLVTSRQNFLIPPTKEFVAAHFPGKFSKLSFGNAYSIDGKTRTNLDICREINARLLVEDIAKYALEVSQFIPVIMPIRPWNKSLVTAGTNIIPAENWPKIVEAARKVYGMAA